MRRQTNGKAAGPDGLPYEMYENGGKAVIDRMTELFTQVREEERVPRMWNSCRVTLLHKGGYKSKNELKNYRPIALVNTGGVKCSMQCCVNGLDKRECYVSSRKIPVWTGELRIIGLW